MRRREAMILAGASVSGLGAFGVVSGCALPPARDDRWARGVEALVQPLVKARQFSGAVVLMRGGRTLAAHGWGLANRELGLPFTPQTPCDAASLAKNFTAAGILQLVDEGRLAWQQPVQALVPEYPHAAVTVAHLLTHSSGLVPDYAGFDRHFAPGQLRTTRALLALAGRAQPGPRFAPGSRFEYADLPYDAAALVIERVSGQPFADFVRERFWGPHGLVNAFARPAFFADWPAPRTRGYRFAGGCWRLDDAYDGEAFVGASNLWFSAQDLARWGDAWAHARVLSPAADRAGHEVPVFGGQPSPFYRLGWQGGPQGMQGRNVGHYNGFRAFVHWDRARRETVAFVSNGGLPEASGLWLQQALVALLAGEPVPAGPVAPALPEAGGPGRPVTNPWRRHARR